MDAYGLLSSDDFRITTGRCTDCGALPQALWHFRDETIAVPKAGMPLAGFERSLALRDDLAAWVRSNPPGAGPDYPPLVWIASPNVEREVFLDPSATKAQTSRGEIGLKLSAKLPLNRAWFDASSAAFLHGRPVKLRGNREGDAFVARTFWPEDFRVPGVIQQAALAADPTAVRAWVRAQPAGGARSPFAVESVWRRPDTTGQQPGQPLLGLLLNGAQGDDDEAHGGHFALMVGRVGEQGAIDDLLVFNFYTLDAESEKGIIAAPVPLDNYLGDLNSGQAWYRPSYMLLATLGSERIPAYLQSALGRVYNQFYRHQFAYQHARANCAGISVTTLRTLGWQVPARGPESWLRAVPALALTALKARSLRKGKAAFDYLTEDRTRLYPAAAFEEIAADLLRLASGQCDRALTDFERLLAKDIGEILLVRVPQFPSSRAWGDWPAESTAEYVVRVPKDPEKQQIIPVPLRSFPPELRDPQAPAEPPLRSDYAAVAWAMALIAAVLLILRRLLA